MFKNLICVTAALQSAGFEIDQIAKSTIIAGEQSSAPYLFLAADSNQVDPGKASEAASEPLIRADGAQGAQITNLPSAASLLLAT